ASISASASSGGTAPVRMPCHLISRSSGHACNRSVSCQRARSSGQRESRIASPPSANSPGWSSCPLSSRNNRCTTRRAYCAAARSVRRACPLPPRLGRRRDDLEPVLVHDAVDLLDVRRPGRREPVVLGRPATLGEEAL